MKKTTTPVAPTPVIKKVRMKKTKPLVEMISYSIEMTIPTGQYANIKPQIVVKAGNVEDAHNFIAPHMNKLWKEYYLVNERRPEPVKVPVANPVIDKSTITETKPSGVEMIINTFGGKVIEDEIQPPASSVALVKATQAIESCLSLDALELIQQQIIKSVKLTEQDKESLMPLLLNKSTELTEKNEKWNRGE